MELRHLRYFRVVAEELHFGRAAARLHMEPQPLNFQMKQLERELGFPLLTRKENQTRLTAAGEVLAAEAVKLLDAVEAAVGAARRASRGETGVLRLGYANTAFYDYVMPSIDSFREAYPAVSFEFHSIFSSDQFQALRQERLDIGINMLPMADPAFASKITAAVRPLVVVSTADPLAQQDAVEWGQLHGRSEVVLAGATKVPFIERVHAMLAEHGVELRLAQTARDDDTLLTLVGLGVGLTIVPLPQRVAPRNVKLLALPDDAPTFFYGLVWLASVENPLRDRFLEHIPSLTETQIVDTTARG